MMETSLLPFVKEASKPEEVKIDPSSMNIINEDGQSEIRWRLRACDEVRNSECYWREVSIIEGAGGWAEVLPSGNGHKYQGKFAKRVAKAFKDRGVILPADCISRIGEIASRHTIKKNFFLDFTDVFDWSDGDFGDDGSCFWADREKARFILMAHGVWAVRLYRSTNTSANPFDLEGIGRAWVVVDKTGPGELLVFNMYGPTITDFQANLEHWLEKRTGKTYKGRTRGVGIGAYEPLYMNHDALLFTPDPCRQPDWVYLHDLIGWNGEFDYEWYKLIPGFVSSGEEPVEEPEEEEEPWEAPETVW